MTEVLDDNVLKWVVGKIYSYSRWSSNPFELTGNLGYGAIGGNYKLRVYNIIHFLQDEAGVLHIIREPAVSEQLQRPAQTIGELFESEDIEALADYVIELLPGFKHYAEQLMGYSPETNVTAGVVIKGNDIVIEVGGQQHKLHELQMESIPFKILSFLMRYPDTLLNWKSVKLETDTTSYRTPPSEFVRQLGFSREIRDMFFPVRNKTEIKFRPTVSINADDAAELVNKLTVAKP